MKAPSSRFRSWALQATALLAVAMGVHASHASPPSTFEWVESVPVETRYGLPDTARTAAVWLSMIDGARDHIDIAAFYLTNPPGRALSPIVDALKARAASGIRVRLLVDASFMHESQAAVDALAGSPGIVIRQMPVKDMTGGVLHVKFMEVDDHDMFVGSQNWDWRALEHIHELGARIDDERMGKTFRAEFDHLWHLSETPADSRLAAALPAAPAFEPAGDLAPIVIDGRGGPSTVFAAFSPAALQPHWLTDEAATLERLLRGARSRIRIQVMTLSALRDFGPKGYWPTLDSAIRDAAARGVRVQVIVADWALHGKDSAYLRTLAAFPGIEVRVSTVPPASTGPIPYARVEHAKYALVDEDSGFIGTGNWSWSYFESSVDASLFVHGPLATTLGRIFDADWAGPYVRPLAVPRPAATGTTSAPCAAP